MKLFISLLLPAAILAQETRANTERELDKIHVKMYKSVSPAIVGVKAGQYYTSGAIIDKDGYVVTSSAVAAHGGTVYVYLTDEHIITARKVKSFEEVDVCVLKIDKKYSSKTVPVGDSSKLKVGQIVYAFGDSFKSIFTDFEVAFSVGTVTGFYDVTAKGKWKYSGKVVETSTAVNPNQDGGALVNTKGELVGLTTLNYAESRFAGVAIPVNEFKQKVRKAIEDDRFF